MVRNSGLLRTQREFVKKAVHKENVFTNKKNEGAMYPFKTQQTNEKKSEKRMDTSNAWGRLGNKVQSVKNVFVFLTDLKL